jgi:hypothetical protein
MLRLAPALLCCALLVAGCAGFAADDPETPGPVSVPEVTVPTPEGATTATARPRVAPGATRAEVVDPDALVTGHVERLRNASILFAYERTVTDTNGTVRRRVVDGRFETGPRRYRGTDLRVTDSERAEISYRTADGRIERRTNGSGAWTAVANESFGSVATTRTGSQPPTPFFRDWLDRAVSAVALNRTTDPEGMSPQTTTYHYRGTVERAELLGERVRNVSVLVQVEPTGVIMSARLRYERVATGERVTETLDYGAVWFGSD